MRDLRKEGKRMRDKWREIRRFALLAMFSLCISSLIYLLLPKSVKSTATFTLTLLGAVAGCFWFNERMRRRREEESMTKALRDLQATQTLTWMTVGHSDMRRCNRLFKFEDRKMGEQFVVLKVPHHGQQPMRRANVWKD